MRTTRAFTRLLICLGLAILAACGPNPEQVGSQVKASMQQTFWSDPNLSKFDLKVTKVVVVKEAGNKYQGIATIITKKGTEKQVPVQVTAEGENVIWTTEPGTFMFAAQEELAELFRQ